MSAGTTVEWDLDYRPHRMPRVAIVAAAVVLAIHITFAALLTISDTGVHVGGADQFGLALIGLVEAGLILLFTQPRLRVGPAGVAIRNLLGERVFEWDRVRGMTYPDKGFSARLLLPADEHVPVLAVQAWDSDRAVDAMTRFRELAEQYRPSSG
ncbi:PH domain-containing protein [Gordonia sp. SL306]|uniref:PH domain-containing protein n=1 Tax=Gordonia sp. SL306 TaxID=2995145 RepID=UPI0022704C26|nr:PH domain-containing protein [Gordonia sp. SL306]WAC55328.1 PH domain-containing protein [Gordonia sp. SL306]